MDILGPWSLGEIPLPYGCYYYVLKSILHIWMTLQFPKVFTFFFFVSLNALGTPVKEATIGLTIKNFQEEEIAS